MFDGDRGWILHSGLIHGHCVSTPSRKYRPILCPIPVFHSLRLCSLFYCLLCRVAIVLTSKVAACSTSSSFDQRPRVKRSAPSAVSRDSPIANNTGEGSVLPS